MKDRRPLQMFIDVAEVAVLIAAFGYDSVGAENIIKAWVGTVCVCSVLALLVASSMEIPEPQRKLPQSYTSATCIGAMAALVWFGWPWWATLYGIAWFCSHTFRVVIEKRRAAESA